MRKLKLFAVLFLAAVPIFLVACQSPAADPPQTEPAPPVLAMSSPEGTAERTSGEAQPPVTAPPASQPDTTAPIEPATQPAEQTTLPAERTSAPAEQTVESEAPEGLYLLVNGVKLAPGMKYAEVKNRLGPETAPEQALGNCDGSSFGTMHSYPGMTVSVNEDGVLCGIEVSAYFAGKSEAALLGRVGLGATMEAAVAALGEPENAATAESDRVLTYRQDGWELLVCFFDPENPNAVSGISMTLSAE